MTESEHIPNLCPTCGGLTIVRWDRLDGATGISIDGRPLPAANLWIAEQPGPCAPPTATKEN